MKKLLLLNSAPARHSRMAFALVGGFLILHSALLAQSPDWLWAKGMGGTYIENGFSIAIDASDNVYTTGFFSGTADFDPGAAVFNLTGNGIFISKLDNSGNFVFAKAIGGGSWVERTSIAIDTGGIGAIYTAGVFAGTADFDPGPAVFNLTATGQDDIFISKLDSSGNFIWAKAIGDTLVDMAYSIAIDASGNIYTTGHFGGTADFDPGTNVFNLTSVGGNDIFISKLDSSGNFIWAKAMGGKSTIRDRGHAIAIDHAGSGDVYTTGFFSDTVDFDPGTGVFNLTGEGGFISKLDSSGNFIWAKAIIGGEGFSITIDHAGSKDVYTTGHFYATVDFDPGVGVFNLTSSGGIDIFISRLDSLGNFVWAKAMGGTGYNYSYSIAIDRAGSGGIYTTGYFGGTADFDPGVGIFNLTAIGDQAIFVSKLDSSGNFVWAKSAGGVSNGAFGSSIALDASGYTYVSGWFLSPMAFDTTTLTNAGGIYPDIFVAKLETMTIINGTNDASPDGSSSLLISIVPNPFAGSTIISFSLSQSQNITLKIFDVNGRLVSTLADKMFEAGENIIVWRADDINAGVYFLKFQTAENLQTTKLIVTR